MSPNPQSFPQIPWSPPGEGPMTGCGMAQEVQRVLHNTRQEMSAALESQAGTCLCLLWSQELGTRPSHTKCSKSLAKQANGNSAFAATSRWPFYQRCYPENTTNRLECKQHTFLINKEGWQLAAYLSLLICIATVGIWEPFITYTCEQMSKETMKSMAFLSMLQSTGGHIKNFSINPGLLPPSEGFLVALTSMIISLQLVQDLSSQSESLSFLHV